LIIINALGHECSVKFGSNDIRNGGEGLLRKCARAATVLAIGAVGALIMFAAARADEAQAKALFKAMSDYLAAQNAISSEYGSQEQKWASSGTFTLNVLTRFVWRALS